MVKPRPKGPELATGKPRLPLKPGDSADRQLQLPHRTEPSDQTLQKVTGQSGITRPWGNKIPAENGQSLPYAEIFEPAAN